MQSTARRSRLGARQWVLLPVSDRVQQRCWVSTSMLKGVGHLVPRPGPWPFEDRLAKAEGPESAVVARPETASCPSCQLVNVTMATALAASSAGAAGGIAVTRAAIAVGVVLGDVVEVVEVAGIAMVGVVADSDAEAEVPVAAAVDDVDVAAVDVVAAAALVDDTTSSAAGLWKQVDDRRRRSAEDTIAAGDTTAGGNTFEAALPASRTCAFHGHRSGENEWKRVS